MVIMNIGALRDAESGTADRRGLAAMKAAFAGIASDPAMFGEVPNAGQAAAALEQAAQTMLAELEGAGQSVEDITASAAAAARIGLDSDNAARQALSSVVVEAVNSFELRMTDAGRPGVGEG
jgi:hypothetical protein